MSTDAERGRFYGAWCALMNAAMEERRLRPTQFAELLREKHNNLSQYMHGQIKPPLEKLDAWAAQMGLSETEKEKFIRLANIAHTPPVIVEEIDSLRTRLRVVTDAFKAVLLKYGEDPRKYGL